MYWYRQWVVNICTYDLDTNSDQSETVFDRFFPPLRLFSTGYDKKCDSGKCGAASRRMADGNTKWRSFRRVLPSIAAVLSTSRPCLQEGNLGIIRLFQGARPDQKSGHQSYYSICENFVTSVLIHHKKCRFKLCKAVKDLIVPQLSQKHCSRRCQKLWRGWIFMQKPLSMIIATKYCSSSFFFFELTGLHRIGWYGIVSCELSLRSQVIKQSSKIG
jgi:hypothetical protein